MFFWKKSRFSGSEPVSAETIHTTGASPVRYHHKMTTLGGLSVVIVAGSLGAAAYFYHEYRTVSSGGAGQNELETVTERLSKIADLPTGETPTLATVTDKTKLSEQSFFARAENGDKVLLYQAARQAFLYRPSTGKLVNVAPINVKDEVAVASGTSDAALSTASESVAGIQTEASPTTDTESEAGEKSAILAEKAKVALYNGTEKVGITNDFEKDFLDSNSDVEVVAKEPAAKKDYQLTIVIDVSGKQSALARSIAEDAGTSVEPVPEGESVPDGTDILVIVGKDRI